MVVIATSDLERSFSVHTAYFGRQDARDLSTERLHGKSMMIQNKFHLKKAGFPGILLEVEEKRDEEDTDEMVAANHVVFEVNDDQDMLAESSDGSDSQPILQATMNEGDISDVEMSDGYDELGVLV